MQVVDTDYANYAVVYACGEDWSEGESRNLWILSRKPIMAGIYVNKAAAVLKSNDLSDQFLDISRQGCDYSSTF